MIRWFKSHSVPKNEQDLKLIRFFIKCFGYRPTDLLLFKTALTHKSLANSSNTSSNERLEFLGDTILDAVIADYLYHKFPNKDEGYLTKVKSKIVSRKTLTMVAERMELSEVIFYQKGRNIRLETLEGNALEAIIGAIYLDGGYKAAEKAIKHNILRNYLHLPTLLENDIDFKSQLFIWAQKNHLKLDFRTLKEEAKGDNWVYEIEILINGKPFGKGIGSSKKRAEQSASKETLELLGNL